MSLIESVLLGILQGLTEFLPVSSSGHLSIAQALMDFKQPGLLFDTLLHCATLGAVLIFFRQRVALLFKAFLGIFFKKYAGDYFENKRFLWGIVLASIPTAIIGLTLEKTVISAFENLTFIGYALILTSLILAVSDNFHGNGEVTLPKSILIGVVQGLAVIPGISRSGSTICAGVMLGINRAEMAEFSFLMSVPAILGATLLQAKHISAVPIPEIPIYAAGMLAAFISGMFAIGFMIKFVKKANLKIFAVYCLIAGVLTVVFL